MDKKILSTGLGSLLVLGIAAVLSYYFTKPSGFRGTSYAEPYPPAPQFELQRGDGSVFRLSDQRGKVTLIFFGYTSCPDVCPTTLAELKQVMDGMKERATAVQVVFISVDPERDTPQRIQEYVNHFNSSFIGLSGAEGELQPIWDEYGVFRETVQAESALGYIVNHTARVTLIDADGNMRLSYGFQTPVADIVHDLNLLLK
jgi:protein SCO1/2